jgi:hypothetical protein
VGFREMEMMFAPSFKVRRGVPTCHYIKKVSKKGSKPVLCVCLRWLIW